MFQSGKIFKHFITVFLLIQALSLYAQDIPDAVNYKENPLAVSFFIAGKTAELKEDFRGALENYRIALRYENSPGIHFAISNINIILGNYQDALIDINNALKLSPGNTEFLEQQAKIYNGTGKYVKAAEIYEDILSREPENIPVLYSLARVYQEQKLPARAIVIYEKITDVYGFDFDVLKRMYDIYFNYKDFEINIDNIRDLGLFIEIEKQGEENLVEQCKNEIIALLEKLGISVDSIINQGYVQLALQQATM